MGAVAILREFFPRLDGKYVLLVAFALAGSLTLAVPEVRVFPDLNPIFDAILTAASATFGSKKLRDFEKALVKEKPVPVTTPDDELP